MSLPIGKLVSLFLLSKSASERHVLSGFMGNLATVVGLSMLTGMMAGAFLLALVYGAYRFMIAEGLDSEAALFFTALIVLLITVISTLLTMQFARKLVSLPKQLTHPQGDGLIERGMEVAEAFMAGLITPQPYEDAGGRPPASKSESSLSSAKL